MRDILALLEGRKVAVAGTVEKFSTMRGYAGRHDRLMCLTEVRTAEGEPLTDGDEDYGLCRPHQCRVLERAALPAVVQESPQLEGQGCPDLVVPNPRGAILPPAETLPYSQARELLLARIGVLQAETGTAPSLPRLGRRMAMPSRLLLQTLHQLARDGQILFTPNGTVLTAPQKGIYA
jgi:hypothetical protein